ncbi:Gfo/Idh/MocA family protein [Saccharopolyspora sp. ASAGF58]|uniref:Gfo/Idh/MocA family protein n=1 Tax=Saccharopolyspora sp. ASAGF58 TaxID=2719023 RepID=UPI0014462F57|nr:Gfo/Idh/MocA family oxidoreductase [Saccharopolyspora sp. ASAGF58]
MPPIRIAVMGAGLIGREHARFITESTAAELVGIADPSQHAEEVSDRYRVPRFVDYETMLDTAKPEAVVIALPNVLHAPAAIAAMQRGVPALVEKPIAADLRSAVEISRVSNQTGVPILVGYQRRHSPDIQRARACIEEGALGDVVAVNGMWFVKKHDDYFDVSWRRHAGGGPILINLTHDIDCFRYLFGDIESVHAVMSNRVRQFDVEDSGAVLMRFASGAVGSMTLSDTVPSPWVWDMASGQAPYFPHTPANCYCIGGTKASLAVPAMELWSHEPGGDWRDPLTRKILDTGRSNAYHNQLNHFAEVAHGKVAPLCSAEDGLRTLAATLATEMSAREGRTVAVQELLAN